jgi:hypothetical protein
MSKTSRGAFAVLCVAAVVAVLFVTVGTSSATPVSGAIFTTDSTGLEVNVNQYAAKTDVYLNGGPGVNAPIGAAGLSPDGTYVFQVTDPSGKTLLSQDAAQCREVTVTNGVITGVTGPCPHATGLSLVPPSVTVQLCTPPDPGSCFDNTPNPGGVYKAWMTPLQSYGCDVTLRDCNRNGYKHGFLPSQSKTDNFKVSSEAIREIDTDFVDGSGQPIDGLGVIWTDPLGASNEKWSYYNQALDVNHEAHVEAIEQGTHYITVNNQPGCTVTHIHLRGDKFSANGAAVVPVKVPPGTSPLSIHVDVTCG